MNNLVRHLDVLSSSPRRREIVEVASPDGTITTVTLMEPLIGGALSEILYPDPQQFAQAPAHYAVVNNRKDAEGQIVPYPVGLLSDVIAIELTVVPNEGDTPVERSTLYQLYDRDYILFNRLLAAAMRVTGCSPRLVRRVRREVWAADLPRDSAADSPGDSNDASYAVFIH